MTINPIVCHPTDNIDNMLEIMASNQIRRIPVVDKQWCVVGIISQADIAIRLDNNGKAAHMIEQISQPDLVASN
jgi:predicted transcriptional regulator